MSTMTEATTRTIDAPGATVTYDVRPGGSPEVPPLFLMGAPMGAAGFESLASHFPDRTIVTYDPRGADRSTKDDPTTESNVERQLADGGDAIPSHERARAEMLVTDARQAIKEEAPLERLRTLTGELQQALQGLMLAASGSGGGRPGGPSQPPPGGDDDVIDADFTPS